MMVPVSKHPGGRPRANVNGIEVVRLRQEGKSWREIAKRLGVGTATAMRSYDAVCGFPKPSQNSQPIPQASMEAKIDSLPLGADSDLGEAQGTTARQGDQQSGASLKFSPLTSQGSSVASHELNREAPKWELTRTSKSTWKEQNDRRKAL
jgi:hypothetical protein